MVQPDRQEQPCRPRPRVAHITAIDASIRRLLMNQLLYLKAHGFDVCVICSEGPNREMIEAQGIPVYPVPLPRKITPITDLVSLGKMVHIMRRERIDIVHGHTLNGVLWGQMAGRLSGCPIVLQTVHGFFFHDNMPPSSRNLFVNVERMAALSSDAMLSQSWEDVETAINEGIGTRCRHIVHLGNGIDVDAFDPARFTQDDRNRIRQSLGFATDDKIAVIVGRQTRDKGYFELCDAMKVVLQDEPKARLLCIGPSDEERKGAFDPVSLGLSDLPWICFAGRREDIPQLLHACDVAVLPSHYEGYPRFLMEAHAMGLASVATNVRGCREVVDHGVTGMLVPLLDVPALADAIKTVFRDTSLREQYGRAARQRACKLFDEQDVFHKVEQMYRLLLEEKKVDRPRSLSGLPKIPPLERTLQWVRLRRWSS